jgi:small subunit ribosomal protein S7
MAKAIRKNELTVEERLINYIMKDGKKTVAQRIYNDMLDKIVKKGYKDSDQALKKALENIYPVIEVRPKRIGGAVYQVPIEVVGRRRITLGLRWFLAAVKQKKGKSMADKLADEVIQAIDGQGAAVKKKEDVHKMAEANKAFAHFARY